MMAETIQNSESNIDNLRENDWVKIQTQEALKGLKENVTDPDKNFYEKTEEGKVKYHMDVVKGYLTSIKDKSWAELTRQNTSAWIMAVQIALKSMGYEVGHIDGVLGGATKNGVREFQKNNNLKVDGLPGKNVVNALLGLLPGHSNGGGAENQDNGDKNQDNGAENQDNGNADDSEKIDDGNQRKIGVKEYSNGDRYDGELVKGLRDGKGTYICKGGNWVYEGGWSKGKMDGVGKMTYGNGLKIFGVWEHGKVKECSSYGEILYANYWRADQTPVLEMGKQNYLILEKGAKSSDVLRTMNLINFIVHSVKTEKKKNPEFIAKGNKLQVRYNGMYGDNKWANRKYDYVEDVSVSTKGLVSATSLADRLNKWLQTR